MGIQAISNIELTFRISAGKSRGKNGRVAGTTGKSLAVEAVEIKLTGDLAKHYDVVYRAHVQNKGWLDWVKSGECAGTTGEALHMEALEVRLVEKS